VLVEPQTRVTVGAYINDIQHLDFKTNSYAVDLYFWFRWKIPRSILPRPR
jgi:hypothetical protein